MAKKIFLTDIDLNKNELLQAAIQRLAVAPVSPVDAQIYFNTVSKTIFFWDGTQWIDIGGAIRNVVGTLPIVVSVNSTTGVATVSINAATPSTAGSMSAADKQKLDAATATNTNGTLVIRDGSGNFATNQILISQSPTDPNHVVRKAELDALSVGLDFQADVEAIQTNNTLNPGASPVAGTRYIITNPASLHVNFGSITSLGANDIVGYNGTAWVVVYDVSVRGEGAITWVRDQDTFFVWDGTTWTAFGGLSGVTAGAGLTKTGNTIDVVAANDSIVVAADSIRARVDDTTIEVGTGVGLRVKAQGITPAQLGAVAGTGLLGGAGTALSVNGYIPVSGTTVTRKIAFTATIGTSPGAITLSHNMGTRDVMVQVYDNTTYEAYECEVTRPTVNTIVVDANGTSRSVRVIITG